MAARIGFARRAIKFGAVGLLGISAGLFIQKTSSKLPHLKQALLTEAKNISYSIMRSPEQHWATFMGSGPVLILQGKCVLSYPSLPKSSSKKVKP
jgi:hypothetical protein